MRIVFKYIILFFFIGFCIGCKEPYEPNLPIVPQGYLVVEGFINAQGATQIKLSRTTPLDQKKAFKAEANAVISVDGENNTSYPLVGSSNGSYSSTNIPINPAIKYRLHIKTKDNKEYLSDFVSVKITPPIDSINWKEQEKKVQLYV